MNLPRGEGYVATQGLNAEGIMRGVTSGGKGAAGVEAYGQTRSKLRGQDSNDICLGGTGHGGARASCRYSEMSLGGWA